MQSSLFVTILFWYPVTIFTSMWCNSISTVKKMHPKQKEIELLQTGFCWEWVDHNFMLHRRRRRQFFKNEEQHQFRKDSFNLYSFELGTKSSMYKKYNMLPKKMKIRTLSQGKPPQGRVSDRVTKQSRPTPKPTPRSSPPNHFQRNIGQKLCDITCWSKTDHSIPLLDRKEKCGRWGWGRDEAGEREIAKDPNVKISNNPRLDIQKTRAVQHLWQKWFIISDRSSFREIVHYFFSQYIISLSATKRPSQANQ